MTAHHLLGVGFVTNTGTQFFTNEGALGSTVAVRDVNGAFSSRSEYDASALLNQHNRIGGCALSLSVR